MKKVAVNIVETLVKRVVVEVPDGVGPADAHYFVANGYHAGTDDFLCDDEADCVCDEHADMAV